MKMPRFIPVLCTSCMPSSVAACGVALLIMAASPIHAQSDADDRDIRALSPFEVSAEASQGYRTMESTSGTRINVNLQEIPLTIEVLSQQLLLDTRPIDINEIMQYSASAAPHSHPENESLFTVRGSVLPFNLINGFRFFGIMDSAAVQQVEVVKGPASVLYGRSTPGGMINVISKRPLFVNHASVEATYGSYNYKHGMIDVGRVWGVDDSLSVRLIASWRHRGHIQQYRTESQVTIAPSLSWNITERISGNVYFEWQEYHAVPNSQIPFIDITLQPGDPIPTGLEGFANLPMGEQIRIMLRDRGVNRKFSYNGPNTFNDRDQKMFTADVTFDLMDNVTYRASVYRFSFDQRSLLVPPGGGIQRGLAATPRVQTRQRKPSDGDFAHKHDLLWHSYGNTWKNDLVLSYEEYRLNNVGRKQQTNTQGRAGVVPFPLPDERAPVFPDEFHRGDIWNPAHWSAVQQQADVKGGFYGVSVINRATLMDGRLHLLGGIRYDNDHRGTGIDTTTFQAGALYTINPGLSVFYNYAESFNPTSRTGQDNQILDPSEGNSHELGLKLSLFNNRVNGTVAIFDIDQTGIVRSVFDQQTFFTFNENSGEENVQGLDFDLVFEPIENLQILASYAYLNSKVVSDRSEPGNEGRDVTDTPKHSFSSMVRYSFTEGQLAGLVIGGGVLFEEKMFPESEFVRRFMATDSNILVNVFANYRFNIGNERELFAQLNLDNIFDEERIGRVHNFVEPRRARLTLRYAF